MKKQIAGLWCTTNSRSQGKKRSKATPRREETSRKWNPNEQGYRHKPCACTRDSQPKTKTKQV